jgi:hypothetical protein
VKPKTRKYAVTVTRTVTFTQVVTLDARNADEACNIASTNAAENFSGSDGWGEGEVIGEGAMARVLR